jgi:PST family polysaccharide transporter
MSAFSLRLLSSIGLRFYGQMIAVFSGILLARFLQPESYGRYALLITWVFLAANIARWGQDRLMSREIPLLIKRGAFEKVHGLWFSVRNRILVTSIGTACLLCLGILISLRSTEPSPILFGLICGFNVLLLPWLWVFSATVQASGATIRSQLPEFFYRPTVFIVLMGIWTIAGWQWKPEWVIAMQAIAYFIATLMAHRVHQETMDYWHVPRSLALSLKDNQEWKRSTPRLALISALYSAEWQIAVICSGSFDDLQTTGFLHLAIRAVALLSILQIALQYVINPEFSAAAENRQTMQREIFRLSHLMTLWLLPATISLFVCAPFLVTLLYGQSYAEVVPILRILIALRWVEWFFGPCGLTTVTLRHETLSIMSTLTMIGLMVILTSAFYHMGIAYPIGWAMLLSYFLQQAALAWNIWKRNQLIPSLPLKWICSLCR